MQIIITTLFLVLTALPAHAAVVFQDNFNNWTTGLSVTSGSALPAPWFETETFGTLPATCNGVARPFVGGAGIHADGGPDGSKALQMPRGCTATGYVGLPGMYIDTIAAHSELYIRFYIKFDAGIDKNISQGFKLIDRIIVTNGTTDNNWYPSMRFTGTSDFLANANMAVYADDGYFNATNPWGTIVNNAAIMDGKWHHIEIHIKLAPSGGGRVRSWIDNTLQYDYNNISTTTGAGWRFKELRFGLGNTSEGSNWTHTGWRSLWFDELIISTTYVGPLPATPSGGIAISAGTMTIGAGTMSISTQ